MVKKRFKQWAILFGLMRSCALILQVDFRTCAFKQYL